MKLLSTRIYQLYYLYPLSQDTKNLYEIYLKVHLGVDFASPSAATNQWREFTNLVLCDWLQPKVRQNGHQGQYPGYRGWIHSNKKIRNRYVWKDTNLSEIYGVCCIQVSFSTLIESWHNFLPDCLSIRMSFECIPPKSIPGREYILCRFLLLIWEILQRRVDFWEKFIKISPLRFWIENILWRKWHASSN